MRRMKTGLIAAASAVLLCWGTEARADKIDWSYNWTPSATEIFSDSGLSKLILSNEPIGKATTLPGNSTDIVATNIQTASAVAPTARHPLTPSPLGLAIPR